MKAYSVEQSEQGSWPAVKLRREGKVFAFLIPANRNNVEDRLAVVEMAKPLEGLQES